MEIILKGRRGLAPHRRPSIRSRMHFNHARGSTLKIYQTCDNDDYENDNINSNNNNNNNTSIRLRWAGNVAEKEKIEECIKTLNR